MSDIDALLQARAQGTDASDIDSLLAARASGGMEPPPPPAPPPAPTAGTRFAQGFTDLPTGLGQIAEHVAETPLNVLRSGIRASLKAVGAHDAAALFSPVSTHEFDNIIQQREQDYQDARSQAGQTGIDWWRLGGAAANPANYAMPGGAAGTAAGRIGQAAVQGAAIGGAQPSTAPGSFWYDKAKNSAIGGVSGGVTAGIIEGAVPLISKAVSAVRKSLGASAAKSAGPTASAAVHTALDAQGIDPATVDVHVLSGLKQEAQNALEHGETVSPQMVAIRAKSESLPFPIPLTKGQLLGNERGGPMQFAKEQNLRGIEGVGEPLTNRFVDQNAAAINNLNALGAKDAAGKDALNPVELGSELATKAQGFWDKLQAAKSAAYDAVKNSSGQSAAMDQFTAVKQVHDALDTPAASHAYDLLPANIRRTLDELGDGKLSLTVAQMQALDKDWGSSAHGAEPSVAYAINTARRIIGDAPIKDDVGEEARQAYMAARKLHAQQMSLVDKKLPNGMPNPNYQPIVDDVVYGGKDPATLFQSHFMGAQPSMVARNVKFAEGLDPNLPGHVANTYMGEIKRLALSGAGDERGTISEKALQNFTQPVAAARMDSILRDPVRVQTFRNLADVVEAAKRHPTSSAVNTSNTGSAVVNAAQAALKAGALEKATGMISKIPVVGPLLNSKEIAQGLKTARLQTEVQDAVNPGVTLKSLLSTTPSQAARRALAARALVPVAVGAANEKK